MFNVEKAKKYLHFLGEVRGKSKRSSTIGATGRWERQRGGENNASCTSLVSYKTFFEPKTCFHSQSLNKITLDKTLEGHQEKASELCEIAVQGW